MKPHHAILLLGILGACSPAIPDSAAGVGFDNSPQAQRAREAALSGTTVTGDPLVPPVPLSAEQVAMPPAAGAPAAAAGPVPAAPDNSAPDNSAADIARQTALALGTGTGTAAGAPATAATAAALPAGNPGLSDENDFAAVSARRSPEDDAAALARYRQSYQQIPPAPVPPRSGNASPNIVEYALSTTNRVGERIYSRSGFNLEAKARRNCARFTSPDQAQIAFLAAGGPQRDRKGLDPDGDGFACGWDPEPFRRAARN